MDIMNMTRSYWRDPAAWPPNASRCPFCSTLMLAPKPLRLHDRVCELQCPKCGGKHARVADDPRMFFDPDRPDADCYTGWLEGTGPVEPPFDPSHDYLALPDEKESPNV